MHQRVADLIDHVLIQLDLLIIVVDVHFGDRATQMGILVDTVSEVLDISADHIEPTPAFGAGVNTQFIRGMARFDDQVKILLNIEEVLHKKDLLEAETEAATDLLEDSDPLSGEKLAA